MSSNYDVAKIRFDLLIKKFQNDDKYWEVFQDVQDVSQGIVERVENIVSDNTVYYLPQRNIWLIADLYKRPRLRCIKNPLDKHEHYGNYQSSILSISQLLFVKNTNKHIYD